MIPRFRAWSWKMIDENMLPCSVIAIAGIFSSHGLVEQLLDPARAVEQRELGVQVKMDEVGHGRYRIPRVQGPLYSHSIVDGGFELMS